MYYQKSSVALLISKDIGIKKFFRDVITKVETLNLIIDSEVEPTTQYPCVTMIFVDIDLFKTDINMSSLNYLLRLLNQRYISVPIFIISDEKCWIRYKNSQRERTYIPHLVIIKPLSEIIVETLFFRYSSYMHDHGFNIKKYHGLILNQKEQYAVYNDCKILLSRQESLLLSIFMEQSAPLSCSCIKKVVVNSRGEDVLESTVRARINRVRRKFKEATGLDIITNRYGQGYFLSI
jgi:hypothetical protein